LLVFFYFVWSAFTCHRKNVDRSLCHFALHFIADETIVDSE
jgi:hypothetical protein